MKRVQVSNKVQWFVVGLLLALTSCSLQKRTTMPGWHWEHEKITFHQGPNVNAETFFKERGCLANLSPVARVFCRRLTSPSHCKDQPSFFSKT